MRSLRNLLFLTIISFGVILNYSCFQDTDKNKSTEDDSVNHNMVDSLTSVGDDVVLWEYDAQGDSMIKHETPDNISISGIVSSFNSRYDSIPLEVVSVAKDTVFLKISNAIYLSQRMGTTGANGYMSELVFSLTELPGIRLVDLDFEVGDHASPGLYDRNSFNRKL